MTDKQLTKSVIFNDIITAFEVMKCDKMFMNEPAL